MNKTSVKRWLTAGTLIMLGVFMGAGMIAMITAQGTNTIHACTNPAGQIRIVSDPADCRNQESYLSWNVVGPQGPAGPPGPVGPQGPAGVSGYEIVTNTISIPGASTNQYAAYCPSGKKVLGGGVQVLGNSEATIFGSSPQGETGWFGEVYVGNYDPATMVVYAICAYVD